MASARPKELIDGMIPFIGSRPLDDPYRITLLNLANDHFSSYANWRWLTRAESELTLSNAQSYEWTPTSPILRVIGVYGINKSGQTSLLPPITSAPVSSEKVATFPTMFEYQSVPVMNAVDKAKVVLWPKPPMGVMGKIIPIVKISHTRITTSNLNSENVLNHPDEYNHIFQFFVLDLLATFGQVGAQTAVATGQQRNSGVSGPLARAYEAADKIVGQEALVLNPTR